MCPSGQTGQLGLGGVRARPISDGALCVHECAATGWGEARLTSGVGGERSAAERVHCTPGLGLGR